MHRKFSLIPMGGTMTRLAHNWIQGVKNPIAMGRIILFKLRQGASMGRSENSPGSSQLQINLQLWKMCGKFPMM